jgi:glutamate dehydrogenase (NAD(P)+)
MTVYSGPVFDMAVNQFGVIANHLEIPMGERDRIRAASAAGWRG